MEYNHYCIYHENIITDKNFQFNDFGNIESTMSKFRIKENAIIFFPDNDFITVSDFNFQNIYSNLKTNGNFLYKKLQEHNVFVDYLKITDHKYSNHEEIGYGRNKIGGYHYSQNAFDPRGLLGEEWENSLLMFQFQDYENLSWGDAGSAQFFIKKCDLINLDFSNMLFHWDST